VWLPTSPSGPVFHNRLDTIERDPAGLHDVHGPWEHQGLWAHYRLYDRGTSLFSSEFGVEGMTNRRTHEALIGPAHRWPATRANPVYRHLGDWWNNESLVAEAFGGRLTDLETLRRASQFLQAEGLRYAIEANRRRAFRNSGSIPWQFNESYPNAWCTAAVDHHGDPKPAYHAVARAYQPIVVCASFAGIALAGDGRFAAKVWAWSDVRSLRAASVTARLLGTNGEMLGRAEWEVALPDGPALEVGAIEADLPPEPAIVLLDLELATTGGTSTAVNRYLFSTTETLEPLLDLPPARVDAAFAEAGDRWQLRIAHREGPAALGLTVEDDRPIEAPGWAEVSENAFDLRPGEERTIVVSWPGAPSAGRRLRVSAWNVAPTAVAAEP
jgi:beta-mannosidase